MAGNHGSGDPFETLSTIPAASSFQEIPIAAGTTMQHEIPAMKPSAPPSTEAGHEIFVEGVHVPPKPRKPGEEGECPLFRVLRTAH